MEAKSNSESVEEMDAQIAILEVQLAELKERRNHRVSPLCRIPEEVVAQILVHHVQHLLVPTPGPLRRWLKILRLCRRIWTIALGWPDLWSIHYINSSDEGSSDSSVFAHRWLNLCLRHGPKSGLVVHVDNGLSKVQAERLSHCARSLILDRSHGFQSTAVKLEGLNVRIPAAQQWNLLRELCIKVNPTLNVGLFPVRMLIPGESHNSLTTLQLMRGPYYLGELPSFPQLQRLEIRNLDIRPPNGLRLRELLGETKYLRQCTLHINESIHDMTLHAFHGQNERLDMPHLCVLELWGYTNDIWPVLVTFPDPREELALHIADAPDDASDEQEQVIGRAITFLANQASSTRLPIEYEVDFALGNYFMHFELRSYILPDGNKSFTPLTLRATCKHRATLARVMRYAKRVVFHGQPNFDQTFAALEWSGADVQELHFTAKWRNRWGRLPMVERYLKARKESGNPVGTITIEKAEWTRSFEDVMDIDIVGLGIRSRWLEEGLVAHAHIGECA